MAPEPKKILVVDDEAFILNLIASAIRKEGHAVNCRDNFQGAISALQNEKIDLVITDLKIPGADRQSLCAYIKGSDLYRKIPVVLITGNGMNSLGEEKKLADTVLQKPFDLKQLTTLIRMHLDSPGEHS